VRILKRYFEPLHESLRKKKEEIENRLEVDLTQEYKGAQPRSRNLKLFVRGTGKGGLGGSVMGCGLGVQDGKNKNFSFCLLGNFSPC